MSTIKYILKSISIIVLILGSVGCKTIHRYDFESLTKSFYKGSLLIEVDATPHQKIIDEKKIEIYAKPYYLTIRYTGKVGERWDKFTVSNCHLIDTKANKKIKLKDKSKTVVDFHEGLSTQGDLKSIYIGYSGRKYPIEHAEYVFQADIHLYDGKSLISSENIKVEIKPKYSANKGSSLYDAYMGI